MRLDAVERRRRSISMKWYEKEIVISCYCFAAAGPLVWNYGTESYEYPECGKYWEIREQIVDWYEGVILPNADIPELDQPICPKCGAPLYDYGDFEYLPENNPGLQWIPPFGVM